MDRYLFNLLFLPACCGVFTYPPWRLSYWFFPSADLSALGFIGMGLLATAALWYSFRGPHLVVRYIVVHWMGVSFVLMSVTLLAELAVLGWPQSQQAIAFGAVVAGALLIALAVVASHLLRVKPVALVSDKLSRPHRLVQLSDVHIGSRQGGFMRRVVHKVNSLQPHSVVITGDLIDSSAVDATDLSALSELHAPTYFVIGNHERYANLEKILRIVRQLGITVLQQAATRQGEIQFVGIDDAASAAQVEQKLPHIKLADGYFNVLLYHRPLGWEAAIAGGIDLMLSGHTHNGQIFPFNYLVKQQFKRIHGLYQQGNAWLYVSSGTGTWGPLMRLGSSNEIGVFDLRPRGGPSSAD